MFVVNNDLSIYCTRGDICTIPVDHDFKSGDVVRFKVTRKKDCNTVVIQRDFVVATDTTQFVISLTGDDTKIGSVISKPVDYWYEVEINPDTAPQTIIGYDKNGAKVFKLFPEGKDVGNEDIEVVGTHTLRELVDYALEQAKESGEFKGDKGDPGYTPVKGVDYFDGEKGEKGDTGDGITKTLLWENASKTSAFAAQNITVDLSEYDEAEIEYSVSKSVRFQFRVTCVVGDGQVAQYHNPSTASALQMMTRTAHTSLYKVSFSNCTTDNSANQNGQLIPTIIYGIKGVTTK